MFWWRKLSRSVRTTVLAAAIVLVALAAGWIHACACTGGTPQWRSLSASP